MVSVLKKKLSSKKGFTLAELLIVVAILAVLVGIAIPVFSGQLSDAEEAVVSANIRSARAQASVSYMMEDCKNGTDTWKYVYSIDTNGKMEQTSKEKSGQDSDSDTCIGNDKNGYTVTVYITGTDYDGST